MPTIRVSPQTRENLLDQKHGVDSMDDVIRRVLLKAKLLDKLPPKIIEAAQAQGSK